MEHSEITNENIVYDPNDLFCVWRGVSFHDQIVSYDTSCGHVVTDKPIVYCPYCGRKIKLS